MAAPLPTCQLLRVATLAVIACSGLMSFSIFGLSSYKRLESCGICGICSDFGLCNLLNGDKDLPLIGSERLQNFLKAFRRQNKDWLHQLSSRVRDEIRRLASPSEFLIAPDNIYQGFGLRATNATTSCWTSSTPRATIGRCQAGQCQANRLREIYSVLYSSASKSARAWPIMILLPTLALQIAVMLRSDYFRSARARKIDSTPGPAELFPVVNKEVAKYIAQEPFFLPDLAAVLAESRATAAVLAETAASAGEPLKISRLPRRGCQSPLTPHRSCD